MKKNNKGFTLIELLAVIVILGLLMAIAIPSVTRYISQSRKKTLTSTIQSYINAVSVATNDMELGAMSDGSVVYYVPVSNVKGDSCVSLEKGGTDPFGNWKEAYVVVHYNESKYSYDYYFTFYDDAGYGLPLTKSDEIKSNGSQITNPTTLTSTTIKQQTVDGAAVKILTTSSCDARTASNGSGGTTMITFTIAACGYDVDGMWEIFNYTIPEGMTFEQFIQSSYNTNPGDGWTSSSGDVSHYKDHTQIWTVLDVTLNTVIQNGMRYIATGPHGLNCS